MKFPTVTWHTSRTTVERRIWFQTGKNAVSDGLWTNDGTISMADKDALTLMALESLDPADLPEGAAEWLEKRRRGEEPPPAGRIHVKITPLEGWDLRDAWLDKA